MLTISEIKKTKNSVYPMNRFSQLQIAGQSYRPGGRRQEFAKKLAFGAKLAENTKLTEIPLCPLWLFLNSLIRSIRAIYAIGIRGSNSVILSNSFESLCLCAYKPESYLRAYKALHLSRVLYKSPLFMQNKPNFLRSQMNVNSLLTTDYENISDWTLGENKPNSNPIKPNLKNAKMNVNLYVIEDYRKKDDFIVRINKPNFRNGQNERNLTYNKGLQKKRLFSNPKNKPNSNPIQTQFLQKLVRITSKGQKLGMIGIKLLQMLISYFWGK